MSEERARRKLSGILSADAVGYSRLMQDDEESTIRTLADSKELMAQLVKQYRGRVVDAPGDNLLAEFGSVVDAAECAVKIQQELKTKNAELPDNRKMEFRIGVNLGDVVEEADRIYGDGVNIAARLEGLAQPGGICISRTAYDHVKNKLEFGYEYLGEHSVKNISEPVRVYRVLMGPDAAGKVIGEKRFIGKFSRKTAMAVIIGLIIVAGGLIGWNIYLQQFKKVEPASLDKLAYPLPDKPSVAVLPFDNMSADPEQDYFSDGITEEIITALSKVPDIFVIARNSTFVYKGKPVKIKQVSEELGVRYVIEGSVRKAGDNLRITAQLIDAIKGYHMWAESYDGKMGDVFALQDAVTKKIIAELTVKLAPDKEANIADWGTKNVDAYDAFLQGAGYSKIHTLENKRKALAYFNRAVELDPNFSRAHTALNLTYDAIRTRKFDKDLGIPNARELAIKHLKLAFKNPDAFTYMGAAWAYIWKGQIDEAANYAKQGLSLLPNSAGANYTMGVALIYEGKSDEAIVFIKKAMRLYPDYPARYLFFLGLAQFCGEQYDEAATTSERARKRNPQLAPTVQMASLAHLGRIKEAEKVFADYLKMRGWEKSPDIKWAMQWYQFKEKADRERLEKGLRMVGVE
jgi:TolB-like protein/class 3 adenylate cyclase/Tfp pilus assembly protein PilF